MANMRKVLIETCSMAGEFVLILTDAPKEAIEKWCSHYLWEQEEGINTYFDSLKIDYEVKVLADSENGFDSDDADLIGYDEVYSVDEYSSKRAEEAPLSTHKEIYDRVIKEYRDSSVELNSSFFDFEVSAPRFVLLAAYQELQKELNCDFVIPFEHMVVKSDKEFNTAYITPLNCSGDAFRQGDQAEDMFKQYCGNMKEFLESFNGKEYETGWCRICGTGATVESDFMSGQLLDFVF